MDTGLTTIDEKDIDKHRATAQSMVTRVIVLEASTGLANTALAGTNRRFVSTVSTGGVQRTKEIELAKTIAAKCLPHWITSKPSPSCAAGSEEPTP